MDKVLATVSGYHGAERFHLIKLITQSGATYVGSFNPSITHLVCCKFGGKKYELARKYNIIVVNYRWIEDCVKQGRRVSERPYTKQCGFVMGPFLLDIPVAASAAAAKTTVFDAESSDVDDDDDVDDDERWTDSLLLKEIRLSDVRKDKDCCNRSMGKLNKRSSRQDVSLTNKYDLSESPSFVLRRIENLLPDARQNKDCSNRSKRKLNKRRSRQDVSLTNKYDLPESPSFVSRRTESEDLSCPSPTQQVNRTKETAAIYESSKGYRRHELKSSSDSEEDFHHIEIHHKDVEIGEPSNYSERHGSRRSHQNRHDHPKRTLIMEDYEKIEDLDTFNHQHHDDDDDEMWTDSSLLKEIRLSDLRKNKDDSNRSKRKLNKRSSRQDVSLTNEYDLPESPSFVLRRIENLLPDARQNKDCSNRSKRKLNKRRSRQDVSLTNKYDLPESPSFVSRRIESEDLSCPSPTQRVNRTKEATAICESSKGYRRQMRKNISNELKSSSDSEESFQHTEIHHKDVENGEPSNYSQRHGSRRSYETRRDHPKRTLILEDSEKIDDLDTFNHQHQPKRRNLILEDSENIEDLDTSNLQDQPKRRNLILEDSENIEDLDTSNLHDQPKRRNLILEDSENIEDLGTYNLQDPACNEDDSNEREKNPTLSTQVPLSCVICWTEFSSTRGVLPCGHRFCFSCIQNWADHMASMKMVSTCPLCKASFCSIRKMEDVVSSDQKVYSQTIPNNHAATDVYVLPYGQAPTHQMMPPPRPVCYQCFCREPEELLIRCYSCDLSCVHSYCLDPPQNPWICVQCKDLRMRYIH